MTRTWVCSECKTEYTVNTATGPLPAICDQCDPRRSYKREHERKAGKARRNLNRQMIALSRDLLWYFNHSLMSTPGKPAIVFHVKALNDARGPKETRVALLRLAGACLAWCLELSLGSQVEETRLDVLTAPQSSETEDEAA